MGTLCCVLDYIKAEFKTQGGMLVFGMNFIT